MKIKILTVLLLLFCSKIYSQQNNSVENPLKKTWITYFGKDSSLSIRNIGLVQIQARYQELNKGSIAPTGEIQNEMVDINIPRICFGQFLSYKRLNMFYLLGTSSQTPANAKLGNVYTYETYISYQLVKRLLSIGLGQTLYNGLSRASSLQISQLIAVNPINQALPTAGKTDNLGRQFHFFAVGKIQKLEYRMALVKPMLQVGKDGKYLPELSENTASEVSYEFPTTKFGAEGYVCYQFLEEENTNYSSKSFSYLGSKKIFNIGLGFEYQPEATAYLNFDRDTVLNNAVSYAFDFFADLPLTNGGVITTYGVFYNYDYGTNYLKTSATMNYHTGGNTIQGGGNSEFVVGTGNSFCLQAAYLFPRAITSENHKLQLYTTLYYKNFDILKETALQIGGGLNYYLLGHNAKIGIQYFPREVYDNNYEIVQKTNNVYVQLQVSF